ncbi:hypothetical protein [Paenibacillus turpanensis]|uniref:hypothetical protein n=1 Tax=Paenibacillus turpanensis TaxID=2689078 RepID=UPI00140ABFC3|nr:hypothetical protein [Paenibacillus turpanensis]
MRNKLIALLFVFGIVTLTACGTSLQQDQLGAAEQQKYYEALEDMADAASAIVEVELTGKSDTVKHREADFKITEATVKRVIKGDEQLKSTTVRILEVAAFGMDDHKRNVLFLEKYAGPVIDDAYIVAGVYQGKFKLDKDDKLVYDGHRNGGLKSFQSQIEGLPMAEAEAKIQQAMQNAKQPKSLQ